MGILKQRLVYFLAALIAAAILSAAGTLRAQNPAPDVILLNGKIFTSDAAHPYVQALAIGGERIVATGDAAKIKALAGPHTRQIDLADHAVIPGINDAHDHIDLEPPHVVRLNLNTPDPTWSQMKDAIAAAAAKAPKG